MDPRLMAPLLTGDGVGEITPCNFTTATTGLRSTRSPSTGSLAVHLSVPFIAPRLLWCPIAPADLRKIRCRR